jgi:hypothetical protein
MEHGKTYINWADINNTSNSFLNTFLIILKSCFPIQSTTFEVRNLFIFSTVIREAKKLYYNSLINTSENKSKSMWKMIKHESGKKATSMHVPLVFKSNNTDIPLIKQLKHLLSIFNYN